MDNDNDFIRRGENAQNDHMVLIKYNHSEVAAGNYSEIKKSLKKDMCYRLCVIIIDILIKQLQFGR